MKDMKKYLLPLCYVATLATVPGSTFTCLNAIFRSLTGYRAAAGLVLCV